jgi:membrane-associated phospholipid phosphatase
VEADQDVRSGRTVHLVPPRRRPLVVPVVLLGVLLVGVLSVRYAGDGEAGRIDRALAALVPMRHGVIGVAGEALADLGDPIPIAVLLAVVAAAAWWWRGGRGLAFALLAPTAAMVTTSLVLKPMVQRTRDGSLAFPSGHTTAVASIAANVAILVLGTPALAVRTRRLAAAALALLVVVVGVCLVGRGYHYPTDVLGALGVVVALVPPTALAVDAFADLGDDGSAPGGPDEQPTRRLPAVR